MSRSSHAAFGTAWHSAQPPAVNMYFPFAMSGAWSGSADAGTV
jgi:hypothetical protein